MSAFVELENVSIEYPVFGWHGRSLKKAIVSKAVGGLFDSETKTTNVIALSGINLRVESGCRLGIAGHNGAGKTTLLRTICGIYTPSKGHVKSYGSINSLINIMLGVDFESTGRENIKLRGLLMGLTHKKINEISDDVIEFSGLADFIDMPIRTYSSGMAMRLAFAIATTIKSDILVMDEWLSVGDSEFLVKAEKRLAECVDNSKIMIVASHNQDLLNKICNRQIKIEHGCIIEDLL